MQPFRESTKQPVAPLTALRPSARKRSPAGWLERLGVLGFAFFLLKGLLWLALALAAYLAQR